MTTALRRAREDDLPAGSELAALEVQQAVDTPGVSVSTPGSALLRLLVGIALVAPLGGLLAPLGGSGADVFSGTGALAPETERWIVLLCFWAAALGHLWAIAAWWRRGRPKDGNGLAATALGVAASAAAAWWHLDRTPAPELPAVLLPIVLSGALALFGLIARISASGPSTAKEQERSALGDRLRALPEDEQRRLLAEREQMLAVLVDRGLIDEQQAIEAAAARLGDWWRLDHERSKGARRGA
ncbi:hypothetical protein AA0Z99_09825 [Agrococcus sp. 1P02AA]|uniref:hypothetical protein n=1 Tax=Agrococcus sp. 1P02AA TaxID=3132259 RepID=UPI0039A6D9A2